MMRLPPAKRIFNYAVKGMAVVAGLQYGMECGQLTGNVYSAPAGNKSAFTLGVEGLMAGFIAYPMGVLTDAVGNSHTGSANDTMRTELSKLFINVGAGKKMANTAAGLAVVYVGVAGAVPGFIASTAAGAINPPSAYRP